jgi:hypothetical protein
LKVTRRWTSAPITPARPNWSRSFAWMVYPALETRRSAV